MTDVQKRCPKCDSQMEEGTTLDGRRYGFWPTIWLAGRPEINRWLGLKEGVKVQGRRKALVSTHRCVNCGYLESYAEKLTTKGVFDGEEDD